MDNPEQKVSLKDCKTSKREEKLGKKSKRKDSRKKEEIEQVLFIDKYKIEVMLGGGGGRGRRKRRNKEEIGQVYP
jgi:hypothetical protein